MWAKRLKNVTFKGKAEGLGGGAVREKGDIGSSYIPRYPGSVLAGGTVNSLNQDWLH